MLGEFATDTQERLVSRFADLDRLAIRTAADRVRAQLLGIATRPRVRDGAPESSELGILLREVNKSGDTCRCGNCSRGFRACSRASNRA